LAQKIGFFGLSNDLFCAQFGLQEVPQTQPQSGTTHRGFGVAHRGFLLNFSPSNSEILLV